MLVRLNKNIRRGELIEGEGTITWFDPQTEDVVPLLKRGAVTYIDPIQLKDIKTWGRRAPQFEEVGITNTTQLFEADEVALSESLGVDLGRLRLWKSTLLRIWRKSPLT